MPGSPRACRSWRSISTGAAALSISLAAPAALVAAGTSAASPKKAAPAARPAVAPRPAAPVAAPVPAVTPAAAEFFEKKIRPVLVANCIGCHSSKSASPMGELRLDSRAVMLKGGHRGPALIPGDTEKSLLIRAVGYQERELQMPPKGKLTAEQIEALTEWVKMGAPWPGAQAPQAPVAQANSFDLHGRKAALWSFQPVKRPALPPVKDAAWATTAVDRFILAKLEARGLKPAPKTDRRTLLRRITYDLTGLPPTPAEVEAFLADKSPDAYRKVVDRLLASPAYGERWARHWLDLVRFAETDGHEFDFEKQNAWAYRDYLIRAFNADVPYNQFLTEHLAGDLMPKPRVHPKEGFNESLIGTGFYWLGEGKHSPVDIREDEAERVDNQIDVISKTFLGLSLGCARCHDHKFDPITTKDYYALYGYMRSSRYQFAAIDPPDRARDLAGQLQTLNARIAPLLVRRNAGEMSTDLEQMPRMLMSAAPSGVILAQAGGDQRLAKYLRETAAKNPSDPLHPWAVLARAGGDREAFSRARTDLARRLNERPANPGGSVVFEDFTRPGYPGWFVSGEAFGSGPSAQPSVASDPREGRRLAALLPAGTADSGSISPRLQGTLRSETFTLEKPRIFFRMGGRDARVNLIIDGFQRIRFPIYGALTIGVNGPMAWHVMDVGKWAGHRAYLEVLDHGDGVIAIDQILFVEGRGPEANPNPHVVRMLADPATDSPEALAQGYQKLFKESLASWSEGRPLDAARVELIDWLLRNPVLGGAAGTPMEPELGSLLEKRAELERAIPAPRRVMAIADGTAENEPVHLRGSHRTLGDTVPRRYLDAFGGDRTAPTGAGSGRLELAQKFVDPANPLVPRVIVNRLWHHHFGTGIVPSPDDFGFMGQKPTHPELLDYLASELVRKGWSLKEMHRAMVLSNTYQMSSRPEPKAEQLDPQNRLLHRAPVRRLEAEAIRDTILAVSGRLDSTMYGPGVLPHLTPFMEGRGRPGSSGPMDGAGRRSIYINVRRNFLTPMFLAFDYPIPFTTIGRRSVSTVPAQALTMMNNPFVVQQAGVWAKRELDEGGTDAERVRRMYARAYSRPATEAEVTTALQFVKDQGAQYGGADPARAWGDLAHVLMNVKEFLFLN